MNFYLFSMAAERSIPDSNHISFFYQSPEFLVSSVAEFISVGLRKNCLGILICRQKLWKALLNELSDEFQVQDLISADRLLYQDVEVLYDAVSKSPGEGFDTYKSILNSLTGKVSDNEEGLHLFSELGQYFIERGKYDESLSIESWTNKILQGNQSVFSLSATPLNVLERSQFQALKISPGSCFSEITTTLPKNELFKEYGRLKMKYELCRKKNEAQKNDPRQGQFTEDFLQKLKLSAIGEFLNGVCREIANPVTAMLGSISVLKSLVSERDFANPLFAVHVKGLEIHIERLMNTTRAVHKTIQPAKDDDSTSLVDSINSLLVFIKPDFRDNSIDLRVGEFTDLKVQIGHSALIQILLSLLLKSRDAIKARAIGNGKVELNIESSDKEFVRITVWDNGASVSPAPDAQSDEDLTLKIAKHVVEAAGGKLYLDTNGSRGNKYVILLRRVID